MVKVKVNIKVMVLALKRSNLTAIRQDAWLP